MIGWTVRSIPSITNDITELSAIMDSFKKMLYSLQPFSDAGLTAEIVFSHCSGKSVSISCFLLGQVDNVFISTFEKQLSSIGYQIEALNGFQAAQTYFLCHGNGACECRAIVKTEKLITTPFAAEGYYYWADALLRDEAKPVDNLTSLFQYLLNCNNASIAIQLMPVSLNGFEDPVLKYLSNLLEHRVTHPGPASGGMMAFEPDAYPAFQAYNHYASLSGQPFYLYNILIYGSSGEADGLSNIVISWIKQQTNNAAELQSIPLCLPDSPSTIDEYPIIVCAYLMNNCRDSIIWGGGITPPNALVRFPFLISAKEAEILFRLPVDDGQIPGVVGTAYRASNEVLRKEVIDPENIQLGYPVSDKRMIIGIPAKDFTRHALVVGTPGTGKTTFAINILQQFASKGIPFLVIEPTKNEYRALIDIIPDLQIFTPGNTEVSPFVLNPFIPPEEVTVGRYIPSLFSAFQAGIDMHSPLDAAFLEAIRESYIKYGWRDYCLADDPVAKPFGMFEFIEVFKQCIEKKGYAKDVKSNLQSAGVLRLTNLLETNRFIFDTVHSVPIHDLLSKPTVIELNAIDNIEQKALIIALLLINISVYIKARQDQKPGLNNIILLDEAHVLLKQRGGNKFGDTAAPQNFAVTLVENMIAELRSSGTGIVIADQNPSAVGRGIIADTDIKITFKLLDGAEKDLIASSVGFDEGTLKQLSRLDDGQAYISYNKLQKTLLVQTPDIRKELGVRIRVSDAEIKQRSTYWNGREGLLRPFITCSYCKNQTAGCSYRIRANAEYYSSYLWGQISHRIFDDKSLQYYCNGLPILLEREFKKYCETERDALIICTRITMIRKAQREKNIKLNDKQLRAILENPKVRGVQNG